MSVVNEPIKKVCSELEEMLKNPDYSYELLDNFLIIASKMRDSTCKQISCSIYVWNGYDLLSINADGGAPYWELSNTVGPSAKKFPLREWKEAYTTLKESINSTE